MREDIIPEIEETEEISVKVIKKEKAEKPTDKEKGVAGRKKVSARDRKKARQVFYSDAVFEDDIEACAEFLNIEPKTFMEMGINKLIKETKAQMEEGS